MDNTSFKIIVTDSGLGGLSVLAEIDELLTSKNINGVDLMFVNAVHDKDHGYNKMKTGEEKAEKFDQVLFAIEKNYNPDLILIACNTLSVIFDRTRFARTSNTKVLGIVEFGVELIYKEMKNNPQSKVIIYGTPTTIESGAHVTGLIEKGIERERIVNQGCYLLETEIQNDAESKKVFEMVTEYTKGAVQKISGTGKIYAALCCTHYGYSLNIFEQVLSAQIGKNYEILNPNTEMSKHVVKLIPHASSDKEGRVEVISKTEISGSEVESLQNFLRKKSTPTLKALQNYKLHQHIF